MTGVQPTASVSFFFGSALVLIKISLTPISRRLREKYTVLPLFKVHYQSDH